VYRLSKKKQKRKSRKKETGTFGAVLMLFGCFFVVLFLGWYMMVGHLDGKNFHGVVEIPLKESYANPVSGLAFILWVIGIPSIIVFLILMAMDKSEFIISCFYSVPIFLLSLGFTIQYMVLLVKVGAESLWWVYVVAAVLGFLLVNLLVYFDKGKLHTVFWGLGTLLIVLSWILLVMANSADGNYIIIYKDNLRGSFSIKTMVGIFQSMGIMIFLLMYGFLLKLRFGGVE
jgi:peptidoglycan/LPS O-acetylase OafA/YrhL